MVKCSKSSKPKLFITICVSSIFVGIVSSIFLYYRYPSNQIKGFGDGTQEETRAINPMLVGLADSVTKELFAEEKDENINKDIIPESKGVDSEIEDITNFEGLNRDGILIDKIRHSNHHNIFHHDNWDIKLKQSGNFTKGILQRLIHFDLKGAPPNIFYLKETIKLAKDAGITGVLLEWEDTFPWSNELSNITLRNSKGYTKAEVKELIKFIESYEIEVIPLIQTFGHAEFILKIEDYSHLRELEDEPQSFCPTKNGTILVIEQMIVQILEMHENSRFIHIGCDEVYNLRLCPLCIDASESKDSLFLNHVFKVGSLVRKYGKIPIIWDDMLRYIPESLLIKSGVGKVVEPMLWTYAEDIERFIGTEVWDKYSNVFPTFWGAGSFKGAFGETLQIPPFSRHVENNRNWVNTILRESSKFTNGIAGYVLTGWSRYDHFGVICELLPAAVPSLIYSSLTVSMQANPIKNRFFIFEEGEDWINTRKDKRSRARWIPHPQILRMKDKDDIVTVSPDHENIKTLISDSPHQKELLWKKFIAILNCPNTTRTFDSIIRRDGDTDFQFGSRCNWFGVNFFRSLFQLRPLVDEIYKLESDLKNKRGWMTPYNVHHRYSLPLRVDELTFDVQRLRRNLKNLSRSLTNHLKLIYDNDVIFEWLEQNIWEPLNILNNLEKNSQLLKQVKYWERRPLKPSEEMINELNLGLQLKIFNDEL